LEKEIEKILNKHCAENDSNTPDFILAKYLIGCLEAFNVATKERTAWYDHSGGFSNSTAIVSDRNDAQLMLDLDLR